MQDELTINKDFKDIFQGGEMVILGCRTCEHSMFPLSVDMQIVKDILLKHQCMMFVDNLDLFELTKDLNYLISNVNNIGISFTLETIEKTLRMTHFNVPSMDLRLYGSNYQLSNLKNDLRKLATMPKMPKFLIFDDYYFVKFVKTNMLKQLKNLAERYDICVIFLTNLVYGVNTHYIVDAPTAASYTMADLEEFENLVLIDEYAYLGSVDANRNLRIKIINKNVDKPKEILFNCIYYI